MLEVSFMVFRMLLEKVERLRLVEFSGLGIGFVRGIFIYFF